MQSSDPHSRSNTRYWPARCGSSAKGTLIALLAVCFVGQSYLVYSDTPIGVVLSEQGIEGRGVWLENNCQACHQLHGFGGFLGPDLTNAAQRLDREVLAARLEYGQGQMPVYELEDNEIDALWEFIAAMDGTGQGQARHPRLIPSLDEDDENNTEGFAQSLHLRIRESGDMQVAAGLAAFNKGTCKACHTLGDVSSIGAPDLSLSSSLLTIDGLRDVLENGRPPRMPKPMMSEEERESVLALIMFLGEQREAIVDGIQKSETDAGSFWSTLPWWEFE